jgi:hypothetical protein
MQTNDEFIGNLKREIERLTEIIHELQMQQLTQQKQWNKVLCAYADRLAEAEALLPEGTDF